MSTHERVMKLLLVKIWGDSVNDSPGFQAEGRDITTIEGLGDGPGLLSGIQRAFVEVGAVQCGYCTPGMMMSVISHLRSGETLDLSDDGIREMLSGNLCRCTGYSNIIAAVRRAAEAMAGH